MFLSLGGRIQENEKVLKVQPVTNTLVKVHTNKESYESVSVVLTCGSWIKQLFSGLDLPVQVKSGVKSASI